MLKMTRTEVKTTKDLTLAETVTKLKANSTEVELQTTRIKMIEQDNQAFQDYIMQTLGGK